MRMKDPTCPTPKVSFDIPLDICKVSLCEQEKNPDDNSSLHGLFPNILCKKQNEAKAKDKIAVTVLEHAGRRLHGHLLGKALASKDIADYELEDKQK